MRVSGIRCSTLNAVTASNNCELSPSTSKRRLTSREEQNDSIIKPRFAQFESAADKQQRLVDAIKLQNNNNNEWLPLEQRLINMLNLGRVGQNSSMSSSMINEPGKRIGHVSVCYEGKLIVWGGYNDEFTHRYLPPDQIWVYDPLSENWSTKKCVERLIPVKDMPPGTSGASACLIDSHMYIFGGFTDDGNTANLYRVNLAPLSYNPDCWMKKALPQITFEKLKQEESELSPIACDKNVSWTYRGRIYIFGGYGLEPSFSRRHNMPSDFMFLRDQASHWHYQRGWNNQLVCYDPSTNAWSFPTYKGSAPCPRAAHAMTQIGPHVYISGGRSGIDRLEDLWHLDMDTMQWTQLKPQQSQPSPEARSWHSLTAISNYELVLYGGLSNSCEPLRDCWLYNTLRSQWIQVSVPSEPRLWHTAIFSPLDKEILIYGGGTQNILNYRLSNVYTNDLITLRFSPKSLLRLALDAVVKNFKTLNDDLDALPQTLCQLLAERQSAQLQQIELAGS